MPCPARIAASKAVRLFSTTPLPCRPRCAKGCARRKATRPGSGVGAKRPSSRANSDDSINFNDSAQRQDRHADSATGMPSRFAKDILHQFRCAIGDLWLIGKIRGAVDEGAQLYNPLDPFQISQRQLHLRDQHQRAPFRSEEHTSELQSLMRISYAVFCLKKKKKKKERK